MRIRNVLILGIQAFCCGIVLGLYIGGKLQHLYTLVGNIAITVLTWSFVVLYRRKLKL